MDQTAVRGRLIKNISVIDDGVVIISGGRVVFAGPVADAVAAGHGPAVHAVSVAPETYVLPGLVDLHNHGGGGVSFPDVSSAAEAMTGVLEHRRQGTTTLLASLITARPEVLIERAAIFAELAVAGEIEGIHVEGPFLSHPCRGAHNPIDLQEGSVDLVRDLVKASGGFLRSMTIAPEVPGVTGPGGVAEELLATGVLPSLGHTDGSLEQAQTLINQVTATRGAASGTSLPHFNAPRSFGPMTATHLFNGMRPVHHRDPGPIMACLAAAAQGDMVVEIIGDGVHLTPSMVRSVFDLLGAAQVMLVTDATAATGLSDGPYDLGSMSVMVHDGVARLVDGEGPLAGGTAHLIDVVRRTVAGGVPLTDAVRSATAVPASVLGLAGEVGCLEPGARADVLVTDASLHPVRVLRHGVDVARTAV